VKGELPEALAAPIWGRYALFRSHPRITGLLLWGVCERRVVVAGERGGEKFDEVLSAPRPPTRLTVMPPAPAALRDTSPDRPPRPTNRPRPPATLARSYACASTAASRSPLGFGP
jgi:hypothetical protein